MKKQFVQVLILSLLFSTSNAAIDFHRAAFRLNEIDHIIIDAEVRFELPRNYHSRSLHRGLFGIGWCSILDWKLKSLEAGQFLLQECDQALYSVHDTKFEYGSFELSFNGDGRLAEIIHLQSKQSLKLKYLNDQLEALVFDSRPIPVVLDHQGRLIQFTVAGQAAITFFYDEFHLTQGPGFQYEYSEYSNLTTYSSPQNGQGQLTYNEADDQLISWYRHDGCFTRLQYQPKIKGFEVLSEELCASSSLRQKIQNF